VHPSLSSDYLRRTLTPIRLRLKHIAEAGFPCVHWGEHGADDYIYHDCEIEQIRCWLDQFGLACTDIHGSAGVEKRWMSSVEHVRQAGVELVRNRIQLAQGLGTKVLVMHLSPEIGQTADSDTRDRARRNIDSLMPDLERHQVSLALENMFYIEENTELLDILFDDIDNARIGLCYDSGHGQITGNGLDFLERHLDRLLALHLHDNNGRQDAHLLPGTAGVDWNRTLELIAMSSYRGPLTLEVVMGSQCDSDESHFLDEANQVAERMIQEIEHFRILQSSNTDPHQDCH